MTRLTKKVTNRSYYDYFPPGDHAPGDIWMHLPTHGLLRRKYASALVVTPSCDLSNRKVSTITYIPIISFFDWVSCADFLPEVIGSMSSIAESLVQVGILSDSNITSEEIVGSELSKQMLILEEKLAGDIPKSHRNSCERYISGGQHIKRVNCGEPADLGDLEACLSKRRWQQIRNQIVKNAFRSDVYFLPADDNDPDMSPIPKHSVALFRYPLTVPVALLDSAQDSLLADWGSAMAMLAAREPIAHSFFAHRPLKCLRLRDRFLSDLLTRFVALYSRLGSPDFTEESVETMSRELGERK